MIPEQRRKAIIIIIIITVTSKTVLISAITFFILYSQDTSGFNFFAICKKKKNLRRSSVLHLTLNLEDQVHSQYSDCLLTGRPMGRSSGPVRSTILTSPYCLDRLWGPLNLHPVGYRWLFRGGKAAGAWNWSPPAISAEVKKKTWIYASTPSYVFMVWSLISQA
jgi:hypothetical protein